MRVFLIGLALVLFCAGVAGCVAAAKSGQSTLIWVLCIALNLITLAIMLKGKD